MVDVDDTGDEELGILSLTDSDPVELEEVEMDPGYLEAAKKHVGAKFTSLKPNPEKGTGGG